MANMVSQSLDSAIMAVKHNDPDMALEVIGAKEGITEAAEEIDRHLVDRLIAEDPHRAATYRIESQLIENYRRIYYFTKRIAKLVVNFDTAEIEDAEAIPDAL